MAAFPIAIPTSLLDEIQKLSTNERKEILSKLFDVLITPISRLHLIRLTRQFGNEEQTTNLISSFFAENANIEISAFLLLLGWVSDALDSLPGDKSFSLEEKLLLSWGHTNELFNIFKQVSVPFDWLINCFGRKETTVTF